MKIISVYQSSLNFILPFSSKCFFYIVYSNTKYSQIQQVLRFGLLLSCVLPDCPPSVQTSLTSLADQAVCAVTSSCANIKCCVRVPLLNRTFEVGVELDYSYRSLRVRVEKMTRRLSLIGYQWGTEETLSVHGVFKLR